MRKTSKFWNTWPGWLKHVFHYFRSLPELAHLAARAQKRNAVRYVEDAGLTQFTFISGQQTLLTVSLGKRRLDSFLRSDSRVIPPHPLHTREQEDLDSANFYQKTANQGVRNSEVSPKITSPHATKHLVHLEWKSVSFWYWAKARLKGK